MGYDYDIVAVEFRLNKEMSGAALQAVRALYKDKHTRFSWVDNDVAKHATHIIAMLRAWGWQSGSDKDGNIVELHPAEDMGNMRLGDEETLFATLAPFVEAGSTIECQGEDGSIWRWRFCGLHCHNEGGTRAYVEDECEGKVL